MPTSERDRMRGGGNSADIIIARQQPHVLRRIEIGLITLSQLPVDPVGILGKLG